MKILVIIEVIVLFAIGFVSLVSTIKKNAIKKRAIIVESVIMAIIGFLSGRFLYFYLLALYGWHLQRIYYPFAFIGVSVVVIAGLLFVPKIRSGVKAVFCLAVACFFVFLLFVNECDGNVIITLFAIIGVLMLTKRDKIQIFSDACFISASILSGVMMTIVPLSNSTYLYPPYHDYHGLGYNRILIEDEHDWQYGVISEFGNAIVNFGYDDILLSKNVEDIHNLDVVYIAIKWAKDVTYNSFVFISRDGKIKDVIYVPQEIVKTKHELKGSKDIDSSDYCPLSDALQRVMGTEVKDVTLNYNNNRLVDYDKFSLYFNDLMSRLGDDEAAVVAIDDDWEVAVPADEDDYDYDYDDDYAVTVEEVEPTVDDGLRFSGTYLPQRYGTDSYGNSIEHGVWGAMGRTEVKVYDDYIEFNGGRCEPAKYNGEWTWYQSPYVNGTYYAIGPNYQLKEIMNTPYGACYFDYDLEETYVDRGSQSNYGSNNSYSSNSSSQNNSRRGSTFDYESQYRRYERLAESHYNSLTALGNQYRNNNGDISGTTGNRSNIGGNITTLKTNLRQAQKDMARIRNEAAREGVHISQSRWETVSVY